MTTKSSDMQFDLTKLDTGECANELIRLIKQADKQYFAPLTDEYSDGSVDLEIIADMNRLMAELTSRYLLSGFSSSLLNLFNNA